MDEIGAVRDFLSEPLGVVGVVCVMSASTAINSTRAVRWFHARKIAILMPYNALNLIGAVSLLFNAVLRDDVLWLMLEVYLVANAIKGLVQAGRQRYGAFSRPTFNAPTFDDKDRPRVKAVTPGLLGSGPSTSDGAHKKSLEIRAAKTWHRRLVKWKLQPVVDLTVGRNPQ